MSYLLTEENLRIHTDSLPRHSTISGLSVSSKSAPMDDPDTLPTISGKDIIMAFGGTPKAYVQKNPPQASRLCSCLAWSRFFLFVINLIIWLAGLTLVGLGSWILVDGAGVRIFRHLFLIPGILLITTGIIMVTVGICGWIGAIRQYIMCLRVYMVLIMAVFIMQLAMGAMAFFMLDHIERDMSYHTRKAVQVYGRPFNKAHTDDLLDTLQIKFKCCGGSSLSDWEGNAYFNCTSHAPEQCGVPTSCCKGPRKKDCGHDVRDAPLEFSEMFVYTEGCVVTMMQVVRKNIMIVAAIAFSVSFVEIFSLILAGFVIKYTVYHKTLLE